MTISTISDEFYDDVIIYKLYSNPTLMEGFKKIERQKVFTAIEEFFDDDLKVCTVFLLITIINLLSYFGFFLFTFLFFTENFQTFWLF